MPFLQKIRSVRSVLILWYTLVLITAFALFGYGVFVYLRQLEVADLEQSLSEEVDWIASLMEIERGRVQGSEGIDRLSQDIEARIVEHFNANPRNYLISLTSISGGILFRSQPVRVPGLGDSLIPADRTILRSVRMEDGTSMRVAARRAEPFIIEIAYTEQVTRRILDHLLFIFSVLAPIAVFLSVAGGWFLSGLVLSPISQISRLAERITAHNLDEQIPRRTVDDELGRLIDTINGMIRRLHASFEQVREFSMSIAHELKTPLTILKGESELALSKTLTPAESERLAATYLEETVRLSRIVEDLLTLAKADAGQVALSRERVPMDGLMRDLLEDAQILGATKGLEIELDRNDPASVQGDPLRLRQLFRALLSNAVQYTDPGGQIRISSRVVGGDVLVDVEDTGIGIPPESIDRIFDRFFRVEEARSRVRGGSGLGLAIAKWIVDAHDGSITVRSSVGRGSTFTVRLRCLP